MCIVEIESYVGFEFHMAPSWLATSLVSKRLRVDSSPSCLILKKIKYPEDHSKFILIPCVYRISEAQYFNRKASLYMSLLSSELYIC
jgi:hypothetical protein